MKRIGLQAFAAAVFLCAASGTAVAQGAVAARASGGMSWIIPESQFGFEIVVVVTFNGRKYENGDVLGRIDYHLTAFGEHFHDSIRMTCLEVYDGGTRVKYGGVVEVSNNTDPGTQWVWFQGIDNGEGAGAPPDQSTIGGVGTEEENEAFCASPAPPTFIFDVNGNIQVVEG
jgi:hypothetical protein